MKTKLLIKPKTPISLTADGKEFPEKAGWEGVIGVENLLTGDGRFIEKGALRWETPMPLRYVSSDIGAHDGAEVVGRILTAERLENGDIWATGDFDMGSEVGREAYRQVSEEYTNGISMDLDETTFQLRVVAELVDDVVEADSTEEPETDSEGRVILWEGSPDDEVFAVIDALVRAATIVAIPAFKTAKINTVAIADDVDEVSDENNESDEEDDGVDNEELAVESLIASALTENPPAAWFNQPALDRPTGLTVTDEGRVYGHLASWGVCHIANPMGKDICVEAPRSNTNYAYFHTGSLKTSDGALISVGQITMSANHAKMSDSAMRAASHYDHTGSAVADVRVGEDEHGIWVAGALRAGVTADQIRELRASPLSGDWRQVAGNLELVAALAVNVPGFPIPRTEGLVASGEVNALVAAGMVVEESVAETPSETLSEIDIACLKRLANRERKIEVSNIASRVLSIRHREKVEQFVKGRK